MRHPHLRFNPAPLTLAIALAISAPGLVHAQAAATDKPVAISIAAQPLDAALNEFAAATGVPVAFSPALVAGKKAPAVKGNLTPREAVNQLLSGSGLVATQEGGSMVIKAARSPGEQGAMLPVVTVKAAAETETATGPVRGYVAKRSTTGTKTDTSIIETPQSISVLGRQEMEDRGALSVMEALRYVPGVVSQVYGADTRGQDDWLNLRGFSGFGTSLYQDGLRMNTDANAFANQRSEPYGLDRIEVLRGPASVLYGKGDAGGIVNRVSKRPRADAPREVEIQLGSRNRQQVAADIGGSLDEQGKVLYRVVGLGLTADTQDRYISGDQVSDTRLYLAPSLTWTLSKDTSLTIMSEFLRDRNDGFAFAYTPPGASTRMSSSILVGEPKFTGFDHDQAAIGYLFEHRLNDA